MIYESNECMFALGEDHKVRWWNCKGRHSKDEDILNIKPTKLCDEEISQFRVHSRSGFYALLSCDNRVLVGCAVNIRPVKCTINRTEPSLAVTVGDHVDITPVLRAALKVDRIDPIDEIHISAKSNTFVTVITSTHVVNVSIRDDQYKPRISKIVVKITFASEYITRINQTNNGYTVVIFKMRDGSMQKATFRGMLKHECCLIDQFGIDNIVQLVHASVHRIAVTADGDVFMNQLLDKTAARKLNFPPGTHIIKVVQVYQRLFFLDRNGACWYGKDGDFWSAYAGIGIDVQLLTALSNPVQSNRQPYIITNVYTSYQEYQPTIFQCSNGEARAVSEEDVHLLALANTDYEQVSSPLAIPQDKVMVSITYSNYDVLVTDEGHVYCASFIGHDTLAVPIKFFEDNPVRVLRDIQHIRSALSMIEH